MFVIVITEGLFWAGSLLPQQNEISRGPWPSASHHVFESVGANQWGPIGGGNKNEATAFHFAIPMESCRSMEPSGKKMGHLHVVPIESKVSKSSMDKCKEAIINRGSSW
jgi:hypothetical protein